MENELLRMDEYVDQVLYVARLDSFSKDYLIRENSLKQIIQPVLRSQANYFIQKIFTSPLKERISKFLQTVNGLVLFFASY